MTLADWVGPPYTPKRVGLVLACCASLFTIVTYVANAMSWGEPHWIATRSFVRDTFNETQKLILAAESNQINIEIRIEESEHRRIRTKIRDIEVELEKNSEAPDSIKRILKDQLAEQRDELETKLETLRRLREIQRTRGGAFHPIHR